MISLFTSQNKRNCVRFSLQYKFDRVSLIERRFLKETLENYCFETQGEKIYSEYRIFNLNFL